MLKTGKVLSLRKIKRRDFSSVSKTLVLLSVVFIAGVFVAVFLSEKSVNNFSAVFKYLYLKRINGKFFKIFLLSLSVYFSALTLIFLSGTSFMGTLLIPLIIFMFGYASGGVAAYLYREYSLKGIAFNAIIILPALLIFLAVFYFASKRSVLLSVEMARMTLVKGCAVNLCDSFKNYCTKFCAYAALTAVISLLDTVISLLFIKLFNF